MLHLDFKHLRSKFVVVAFHTNRWIQQLITSLWEKFPNQSILIINNNPEPGEYGFKKDYQYKFTYNNDIAIENKWLEKHASRLDIIRPENRNDLTHGAGLDLAREWCLKNDWYIMTHIEPDCFFSNSTWYNRQIEAIINGYWMASSFVVEYDKYPKPIPKVPLGIYACTILIEPTMSRSMKRSSKKEDENHKRYEELVSPTYKGPNNTTQWDTGHAVWFHCASHDKAIFLPSRNIWHLGNATLRDLETKKRKPFVPKWPNPI